MSERDQNFFVKDLCTHLQENYNYKGSHATVRRCLIRAGFKRKLVSVSDGRVFVAKVQADG